MSKVEETRKVIRVTARWGVDGHNDRRFIARYDPTTMTEPDGDTSLYFCATAYAAPLTEPPCPRTTYKRASTFAGVRDARDATDLKDLSDLEIMDTFFFLRSLIGRYHVHGVEMGEVRITSEFTQTALDEQTASDFLLRSALLKLSQDELVALGLTNLAVYSRLGAADPTNDSGS